MPRNNMTGNPAAAHDPVGLSNLSAAGGGNGRRARQLLEVRQLPVGMPLELGIGRIERPNDQRAVGQYRLVLRGCHLRLYGLPDGAVRQTIETEMASTEDQTILPDRPLVVGSLYTPNPELEGHPDGKLPDLEKLPCPPAVPAAGR